MYDLLFGVTHRRGILCLPIPYKIYEFEAPGRSGGKGERAQITVTQVICGTGMYSTDAQKSENKIPAALM